MDGQFRRVRNYRVYLTEVLGEGSFGTVLKGYDEKEGRWLAVKTVKLDQLTKDGECIYGNEIETLCSLKGNHIVKLLDAIEDDFYFYLFFEYCEGGDLEALLEKKKCLSEKEACSIVKQIAKAFLDQDQRQDNDRKFISLMHRDIKPANILFSQGKVKVADFGMAKFIDYFDKDRKKRYDLCGTPYYLAPQVLNREHYSAKCDIWSTGILFYEILFGRLPWNATTERGLYEAAKYQAISFPKQVSREVQDLISMMLKFREEERLSWGEVFIHRALKESRFEPKIEKENLPSSNAVNPLVKDLPSHHKTGYDVQKYPYAATGMRYYDRNLAGLLDNKAPIPYTTRYNIKPDLEKPDYNDYKPRPYDLGRNH